MPIDGFGSSAVWQVIGLAAAAILTVAVIAQFSGFFAHFVLAFDRCMCWMRRNPIFTLALTPVAAALILYAANKGVERVTFVSPVEKGEVSVGANYVDISWSMKDHLSKSQYRILRASVDDYFDAWTHTNETGRTDIQPILPEWRTGAVSNFWYCGYSAPVASNDGDAGESYKSSYAVMNVYDPFALEVKYDPSRFGSKFVRKVSENEEKFKEIAVVTGETHYRDSGIDPDKFLYRIEYLKPDIIVGDDIKIVDFRVGRFSKGLYMRWECKDTIDVGTDEFIIQKCWRAIPSRTRYTDWQIIGSTYDLQWSDDDAHWHQDEKYRIIVLKEVLDGTSDE